MTFVQWYIEDMKSEGISTNKSHVKKVLKCYTDAIMEDGRHSGDCTKESHPCMLCGLEILLNEYYKYFKLNK